MWQLSCSSFTWHFKRKTCAHSDTKLGQNLPFCQQKMSILQPCKFQRCHFDLSHKTWQRNTKNIPKKEKQKKVKLTTGNRTPVPVLQMKLQFCFMLPTAHFKLPFQNRKHSFSIDSLATRQHQQRPV